MKRYDSYKPSGISWVGEIPSHWDSKPFSSLIYRINNPAKDNDKKIGLENILSWKGEYIISDSVFEGKGPHFDTGDILYGKLRPYLAKIWISEFEGQAVGDFYVFKTKKNCYNQFIKYALLNPEVVFLLDSYTYGAKMPRVNWDDMGKVNIPLPPLYEQEKIVEFLSTKTSLIDAQQRERERELRLLDELKQAEIANVVTHGLNPDVPMKDSGIPWIGQIPAHWEVMRMKRIFSESHEKIENEGGRLLSLSQYSGVTPKSEASKTGMFEAESTIGYNIVHPGQFVMNIMLAWNGSYAISNYEGIISPAYSVFNFNIDCEKKYFHYLLRIQAYAGAFKTQSRGIIESRLRLYPNQFFQFPCIVPPIEEQKAIVKFIEAKDKAIDEMIANLRAEIDFLTEYKQRLIADVVTGKINVSDKI